MPIENIKCPRLNKHSRSSYTSPDLEVFVRFFEASTPKPSEVMCDEYNSDEKICKLNKKDCTYKSWKTL